MARTRTHRPAGSTRNRAVVIGGSMAGLSAAAVLASRFDSVIVLERDVLHGGPADRRGVPQGRHADGLLPAGLQRLEGWLPGLTQELVDAGATSVDIGLDASWYQGGGHRPRFATGISRPVASRALLEHHVRRRVLALPNVTLRSGAGVSGLTTSDDRSTVTGVTLDDGTTLTADLVVDTSGRAAASMRWLRELGFDAPLTSHVTVDATYASRVVRTRTQPDWKIALVIAGPPTGRQGVVFPLEDGRWLVTLAGMHGERPPTDETGFLAFARSLPSPEIAEFLETAAPAGPILTHRMPSNQRRHVERLRRVPGGLVLLGAAVCSVNPIYGQGLSTAALQAEALGRALDRVATLDARFVRAYYRRAARAITPAWQITTGADFALPRTVGPKAAGTDLLTRYMPHVFRASHADPDVARRVIEVTSLMRPPQSLLGPRLLAAVVRTCRGTIPTPEAIVRPIPIPVAA